ncbi:sensor histidine kinase, partial [Flavobacterium sp.]|uniref:sensor histidine kinase n=1 Tax=Flavobacterium sp. TaxID=239 RepID=UPI0037BF7D3E
EKAEQEREQMLLILVLVLFSGGLLLIILWQRNKQKQLVLINNQQKASEEIYQLLLDQQIKFDEGREKEKKRIARELHDGVMNKLAGIRFNLFKLENKQDSATIEDCLQHVSELHHVEKEIRSIAHDLNMDIFSPKNDYSALIETLAKENDTYDFDLILEMDKAIEWHSISSIIKMNCYRILQESFSNIVKHAEPQKVEVRFSELNGILKLEITDDGVGFDLESQKRGLGIKNILERAQSMKARCHIKSETGKGTTIRIEIPLEEVLP